MTSAFAIVATPATPSADPRSPARLSRCAISPRHYRRAAPFAPSPQAMAGALAIYQEGERHDDVRRMLFGLSILRSATEEQLETLLRDHALARLAAVRAMSVPPDNAPVALAPIL